jgi:hypothetical protein
VSQPALRPLHPDDALLRLKLDQFRRLSTEILLESLLPGKVGALKTRPDGTIIDGHHRITVLRERGVDVNLLPREIVRRVE